MLAIKWTPDEKKGIANVSGYLHKKEEAFVRNISKGLQFNKMSIESIERDNVCMHDDDSIEVVFDSRFVEEEEEEEEEEQQ